MKLEGSGRSLRIALPGPFIQALASCQDLFFSTVVTLIRSHVPESDLCRVSLGDAPADDTAAPDIEHQNHRVLASGRQIRKARRPWPWAGHWSSLC